MVDSTGSVPERHGRQWRFQKRTEQKIATDCGADADSERAYKTAPLDEMEQDEQQERDAENEADHGVERGCDGGHGDHRGGMAEVAPVDGGERRAFAGARD